MDIRVVLAHAQRAAELWHFDRAARVPRDTGGTQAECCEQRLVAAPPELARGVFVDHQAFHQICAARLVELVVASLVELIDLEAGWALDAARPQLAAIQAVTIVLRHARRGGADLRPRGSRLCGGDR